MPGFELREADELRPPYVYYGAWKQFLTKYRSRGMPDSVTEILEEFGGNTKHHLSSGLRSLRLITKNNQATELLKRLAEATDETYRTLFTNILRDTYPQLLGPEAVGFDAANAPRKELVDRFARLLGVASPKTAERYTDFFRLAVREAGLVRDTELLRETSRQTDQPAATQAASKALVLESRPQQGVLPPLPIYDSSWPDDIKRLWFEMRMLEVSKKEN